MTVKRIYKYPLFPRGQPIQFSTSRIEYTPVKELKGSNYVFFFSINLVIEENSSLVIIFPRIYDLLISKIPLKIKVLVDFQEIPFNKRITTSKLTIANLPLIQPLVEIQVVVNGITNPNYDYLIEDFEVIL